MDCPECGQEVERGINTVGEEVLLETSIEGFLPIVQDGELRLSPRTFFVSHVHAEIPA